MPRGSGMQTCSINTRVFHPLDSKDKNSHDFSVSVLNTVLVCFVLKNRQKESDCWDQKTTAKLKINRKVAALSIAKIIECISKLNSRVLQN